VIKSNIEEIVKTEGEFIVTPVGVSMWPLIRNRRDTVRVVKYTGNLKKYDLPVYKRDTGKLIMHRCIGIKNDSYIMCGDNQTYKEYGIKDRHIIGIVQGIYRDEKYIPVTNKLYRFYVRFWCINLKLRGAILRILRLSKSYKKVYQQLLEENR